MRRGTRVGQAYVAITADGSGINEEIASSVDEAGNDIDKAGEEHGKKYGEGFGDGTQSSLDRKMPGILSRIGQRLGLGGRGAGESLGDSLGDGVDSRTSTLGDRVSRNIEKGLSRRANDMRAGIESAFSDDFAERIAQHFAANFIGGLESRLEGNGGSGPLSDIFTRLMTSVESGSGGGSGGRRPGASEEDDFAAKIGKMFGAGSRNNFFNVIGKSMQGVISIGTKFVGVLKGVPDLLSNFQKGFAAAGDEANLLQKALSGLGSEGAGVGEAFSGLLSSGAAAIPMILVFIGAASVLASVLGGLLGIVTALVATIASALAGALLVGGAAMAGLAAAAGLVVLAFKSMTDAQKAALKTTFEPLHQELIGIGQTMFQQMEPAFAGWSSNLQRALAPLAPIAAVVGHAFGQAGLILTQSFSGPGFHAFEEALGTYLPDIITHLAASLGGFMNGFLSILAIVMPYVDEFARHLANVGAEFQAWASSVKGRNAISDFVQRAVISLKSLWGALKSVGGFLADLFFSPQAQSAGNSIFDGISRTFDSLRRKLRQAAADGSLQKWFQSAIKFGAALWSVVVALTKTFIALYNDGVLDAISKALEGMGKVINWANPAIALLVDLFGNGIQFAARAGASAVLAIADSMVVAYNAAKDLLHLFGIGDGGDIGGAIDTLKSDQSNVWHPPKGYSLGSNTQTSGAAPSLPAFQFPNVSIPGLQNTGATALQGTAMNAGGYGPNFVNPYAAYANSLIKNGPGIAATIRNAMVTVNKQVRAAIRSAGTATDPATVKSGISSMLDTIKSSATSTVNSAQDAVNSAAQTLADASSLPAAQHALTAVHKAQANLTAALAQQKRIQAAAQALGKQRIVNSDLVRSLQYGAKVEGATLADYAAARAKMATKLTAANKKLTDALNLKSTYAQATADAINTYGAINTTVARTVNGVEQTLTADDITSNLQDKLKAIREFQANLRTLLSEGLSDAAYKQIVDDGVDQGGAYADALIKGGVGAVSQVNDLTSQINSAANNLGSTASTRLYQTGVDAARGLVDGLTSLSGQLDKAAARLGNSITRQIEKTLGIHSPSRVMIERMNRVGDGIVMGLDAQHGPVSNAAARLSAKVSVSPEVAAYAARRGDSGTVSGNGPTHQWNIITPTTDPVAVARETINEMTGRL